MRLLRSARNAALFIAFSLFGVALSLTLSGCADMIINPQPPIVSMQTDRIDLKIHFVSAETIAGIGSLNQGQTRRAFAVSGNPYRAGGGWIGEMWAQYPKSWDDHAAIYALGHELLHTLGASPRHSIDLAIPECVLN